MMFEPKFAEAFKCKNEDEMVVGGDVGEYLIGK